MMVYGLIIPVSFPPRVICIPSGSFPGKYLRASTSLMTMTNGEFSVSFSVIMRPRTTGVRMASAKPPLTAVMRAPCESPAASLGWPTTSKLVCISIPENGGAVSRAACSTPGALRMRSSAG